MRKLPANDCTDGDSFVALCTIVRIFSGDQTQSDTDSCGIVCPGVAGGGNIFIQRERILRAHNNLVEHHLRLRNRVHIKLDILCKDLFPVAVDKMSLKPCPCGGTPQARSAPAFITIRRGKPRTHGKAVCRIHSGKPSGKLPRSISGVERSLPAFEDDFELC